MYFEDLFDKSTKREYLFLKVLYLNNTSSMKKIELCNKLNITMPTLRNMIIRVQEEYFNKEDIQQYVRLDVSLNEVALHIIEPMNFGCLISKILKNSRIYTLLSYVIDNTQEKCLIQMSLELLRSSTAIGKTIAQCNEILKEFNLKIKNGQIVGDAKQLIYFTYQFYWFTLDSKCLNNDLATYLIEKYSIKLSIVQKAQISLLICVIEKYYINIKDTALDEELYRSFHQTKLFKDLYRFYTNKYINWGEISIKFVTLLTVLFFSGFSMIPFKVLKLYSFKDCNNVYIFDQLITILNEIYDLNRLEDRLQLEENIITTLYRICVFDGLWYSVDEITLNYYFTSFNSKFNEAFIKELVDFLKKDVCFQNKSIQLKYLYKVLVISLFPLKKREEFSILVGYISKVSPILSNAVSSKIKKKLEDKINVRIESFKEECHYDLIISDFKEEYIKNCLGDVPYFKVTNMAVNFDVKELFSYVEEIEYNKFFSKARNLFI